MTYKINKKMILLSLIILAISSLIIIRVYNYGGLAWDFLDLYLNGRTLINPAFYQLHLPLNHTISFNITNGVEEVTVYYFITPSHLYFSLVREPLVPVILALLLLIFNSYAVQSYLIILLVTLLVVSIWVSKEFDINPLLLTSLLFAPYILQWTVLFTSQEILSLIIALVAVVLLAKRSALLGGALALVGLTKYPGLILLPMLLLLFNRANPKASAIKILKASALFAIITFPWLLFNYLYFGNPLISYQYSLNEAVGNNPTVTLIMQLNTMSGFFSVLLYPILILLALTVILLIGFRVRFLSLINGLTANKAGVIETLSRLNTKYKAAALFFVLSTIGFFVIYNNVGIPLRFGYLLYGSASLLAALVIDSVCSKVTVLGKVSALWDLCGKSNPDCASIPANTVEQLFPMGFKSKHDQSGNNGCGFRYPKIQF